MQAGAMELPSIVTNINGCNEIIIEGQNGTIIPVKDSDALYLAMNKGWLNLGPNSNKIP
jgi:glycosyltransferase involved in cell wall biosynthesis